LLLLLKLLLSPALVAGVTLASRRWGVRVGGVLTGLPMVAGPTLCFYAIEQGDDFASEAARAALLGIVAIGAFCVAYAHTARVHGWRVSLLAGWTAFAGAAAALYVVSLPRLVELAAALVALEVARRLIPPAGALAAAPLPPQWDLPLRMAAAALLVLLLTGLAGLLGPRLGGILSAFPVVTVVLAVFTHVQRGQPAVAAFLRALLRGLSGFAVFCAVFCVALGPARQALSGSVALALAAQVTVQALILWWMRRRSAAWR
jgi:hypothetical protein